MKHEKHRLHGLQYIGKDRHLLVRLRNADFSPLHSHDYFELEILLAGTGEMDLNSNHYVLSPGSVYFLTPADFHEVRLSPENRLWNVSFDGSVLDRRMYVGSGARFRQTDPETLKSLDEASRLLSRESEPEGQRLLVEYLLHRSGFRKEDALSLSPVQRAILYVETYFREDPSLAKVSAHVNLSPSHFGTVFREETGETYVEYLNRCKFNCAAMLLKNGKSVTEACFESGFGSLSGFRYVFHQQTGMAPKYYAAEYGKEEG